MSTPSSELTQLSPSQTRLPYAGQVLEQLTADAAAIVARYPQSRSALLPMLHLVQSVDGYVSARGIEFCAQVLGLTTAEVSGVATFYTQYKRHPNGEFTVGVCTNTLCAVMGGDTIFDSVSEHLGIGHDETTADGKITLERVECNAACDYAPVVMVNWEFFDNQTPDSTNELVDRLRAGTPVVPTRGADSVCSFRAMSRVLAGFPDGRADEGVGAGPASLEGLRLAKANGWEAPSGADREEATSNEPAAATGDAGDAASTRTGTGPDAADTGSTAGTTTKTTTPDGGLASGPPSRTGSEDSPANAPDELPSNNGAEQPADDTEGTR